MRDSGDQYWNFSAVPSRPPALSELSTIFRQAPQFSDRPRSFATGSRSSYIDDNLPQTRSFPAQLVCITDIRPDRIAAL
jgi:hypothetical protein